MLAIEVNFLTGRFVATAHNDRDGHEWPPHPARLYSALVSAWAESGESSEGQAVEERNALEWLEAQPPPKLTCSEAVHRSAKTHFVPVNDTRIVTVAAYERVDRLLGEYETELEKAGGELTTKVERSLDEFRRVHDEQTSAEGTKPAKKAKEDAEELLPDGRKKQARYFPSATPDEPRVTYTWEEAPSADLRDSLDGLLERVTRLGHSSSLVSCRLVSDPPPANLVPGAGTEVLRCTGAKQLESLEKRHQTHQGIRPRALPFVAVRYREAIADDATEDPYRPDTAGEWIVLEFSPRSRRLPVTRVVDVASTLRRTILSYAEDPIPEGLSGHQSSGAPTVLAHPAFLALPYVGFKHADGRIMGAAISLPSALDEDSRRAVLRAIGRWEQSVEDESLQLTLGRSGTLAANRKQRQSDLLTLRSGVWNRPSTTWVSATPIALPTNPGRLSQGTASARAKAWERAEQAVAASCRHTGLPEPARVSVSLDPFLRAARPAAHFPAFRQKGRDGRSVARRLIHATVEFDRPVQGPLLLGSGRFIGLGLMRPMSDRPKAESQIVEQVEPQEGLGPEVANKAKANNA